MRHCVAVGLAATALTVGCGGGWEGAALSSVRVQDDLVVLITGCYDAAAGDASLVGGQIVVTTLRGRGQKDNHDCGNAVAVGLTAGPDVVQPAKKKRFALIGEDYRQIDYCGLQRRRCVPFSPQPVPPNCTEASLRFATIGTFGGVYPIEVLGCEGKWDGSDRHMWWLSRQRRASMRRPAREVALRQQRRPLVRDGVRSRSAVPGPSGGLRRGPSVPSPGLGYQFPIDP